MAKLTILIALLAALVLVVHTSAVQSQESCGKLKLGSCTMHIMQRIQQQQERKEEEEDEDHVRMLGKMNYRLDLLDKCCDKLNELESQECQCLALKQIFKSVSEQIEESELIKKEMEQQLKKLSKTCHLEPLGSCDVKTPIKNEIKFWI